jgi:hypothetical protein
MAGSSRTFHLDVNKMVNGNVSAERDEPPTVTMTRPLVTTTAESDEGIG